MRWVTLLTVLTSLGCDAETLHPTDAGCITESCPGTLERDGGTESTDGGHTTDGGFGAEEDAGTAIVDAGIDCSVPPFEYVPLTPEGDEDVLDPSDDTCCLEPDPELRSQLDILATWSHIDAEGNFVVDVRHNHRIWDLPFSYGIDVWLAREPDHDGYFCRNVQIPSKQPEALVRFGKHPGVILMEGGCASDAVDESINPCDHVYVSRSVPVIRLVIPRVIPGLSGDEYLISGSRYYLKSTYYPAGVAVYDDNWSPDAIDGVASQGGSSSLDDFVSICDLQCI